MKGGTTFHLSPAESEEALRLAKQAAGAKDVKIDPAVFEQSNNTCKPG